MNDKDLKKYNRRAVRRMFRRRIKRKLIPLGGSHHSDRNKKSRRIKKLHSGQDTLKNRSIAAVTLRSLIRRIIKDNLSILNNSEIRTQVSHYKYAKELLD